MKNVVVVTKGNNAVGAGDNNIGVISKTVAGSAFLSGLNIVIEIMNSIPNEPSETTFIYLPDTLKAIVSGGAVEYVKSGKNAQGNALSSKEVEGFKEFYKLYAQKILNVRFGLYRYIKKDDAGLQQLKMKAWNTLNSMAVTASVPQTQTVTRTIEIDPDKAIREMLDKKMKECIDSGDFDTYDKLAERKEKLRAPEYKTVTETIQGAVDNSANTSIQFDETDEVIDFSEEVVQESNNPLNSEELEKEQQDNLHLDW